MGFSPAFNAQDPASLPLTGAELLLASQNGRPVNVTADQLAARGAAIQPVTATNATAARTLADRFAGLAIDPRDWGAQADGATDDTAAWAAALLIAAAAPQGAVILAPAGLSLVSAALGATLAANRSLAIVGTGAGVSELRFTGATDGLTITLSTTSSLRVFGLAIVRGPTSSAYANTALSVLSPSGTCTGVVSLEDVWTHGTVGACSWQRGIVLSSIASPSVVACRCLMPNNVGNAAGGSGVVVNGIANGMFGVDSKFVALQVQGGRKAVEITGWVQGVYITNSTLIGCDYGVYASTAGQAGELLAVANSHINAWARGIYLNGFTENLITGNLFLHFDPGPGTNWAGIEFVDCNNSTITGNSLYGGGLGTETGFLLNATYAATGGQPSTVSGNSIALLAGPAIALKGYTTMTSVVGNAVNGVSATVDNTANPSSNLVLGNLNGSTPDFGVVSGALRSSFDIRPRTTTLSLGSAGTPWANVFAGTFAIGAGAIQALLSADNGGNVTLSSAPSFTVPNPAAADSSSKAATTAFVGAQGPRMAGQTIVSGSATLLASAAGSYVPITAAGATVTLPPANAVAQGRGYVLANVSAGSVTLAASGTDALSVSVTTLAPGARVWIASDGAGTWWVLFNAGSAAPAPLASPAFSGTPSMASLVSAAGDSAAQAAGVPIGGLYRNGSVVQVRVS